MGFYFIYFANAKWDSVATVAVNAAKNAGILAARILGATNPTLQERLIKYQEDLQKAVEAKIELVKGEYPNGFDK